METTMMFDEETMVQDTIDVVAETEEEDKVCRIMARDGQIVMQLNSQYYTMTPDMAGAYGLSMIVFGYLENQDGISSGLDSETEISSEQLVGAMNWAMDSLQKMSDASSSLKILKPQDEEPAEACSL